MMHLNEILKILRNHTDIAYEKDGEIQSLVIRETEFYKIGKAILKIEEESNKLNKKFNYPSEEDIGIGGYNAGEFYKD
jgi:hypothetical protein